MSKQNHYPSLYVGCALTHAPEEFILAVEEVKQRLAFDWQIMRFIGLDAGTDANVYNQDIDFNIRNCDAFLAIADYPSSGLGWELGVADERSTPTLIIAREGLKVSRLLTGAADARPHINFARYNTVDDIPELVKESFGPTRDGTILEVRGGQT